MSGRRDWRYSRQTFQRLTAVPVTKKSKVPNLDEAGREYMEQEAADELGRIELHELLRLLCRESRQRKCTCPFSRLMSLPLEMATRWV